MHRLWFYVRYFLAFSSALFLWSTASAADDGIGQKLTEAQAELQKILGDPKNPKSPAEAKSKEEAMLIARVGRLLEEANTTIQKLGVEQTQAKKQKEELVSKITAAATEREQLKKQHDDLVQVQTNLMSGLIGAIVTALVAVAGALQTILNSKPERDLKRLTVIEKASELTKSGIVVPEDILSKYSISRVSG